MSSSVFLKELLKTDAITVNDSVIIIMLHHCVGIIHGRKAA